MKRLNIYSQNFVITREVTCLCGHCNKTIALDVYAKYSHEELPTHKIVLDYYTGQCPYCGKPIIYDNDKKFAIPYSRTFEDIEYLPDNIKQLYNECRDAYSISAYTCCVIAARTLMANIAVEQGADEGKSFVEYVNYLQQNCLPAKTNNAWVDKIRALANQSTHHLVIASQNDAALVIKFIVAILKNIYEFPNSI